MGDLNRDNVRGQGLLLSLCRIVAIPIELTQTPRKEK